tara:strand:- start:25711 stop:27711 length:2001 start_codon:yes stop_codon:yes gene_type:complete
MPDKKVKKDKKRFELIMNRFERDKDYKDSCNLPELWNEYERAYQNKYYDQKKLKEIDNLGYLPTVNLFAEAVRVISAVMTSSPPKPNVKAELFDIDLTQDNSAVMEESSVYAQQIQREAVKVWHETMMQERLEQTSKSSLKHGAGMIKVCYDRKYGWMNKVRPLENMFPDRDAGTMDDCKLSHFSDAEYMSVDKIERVYGVRVKAEGNLEKDGIFIPYKTPKEDLSGHGYALVIEHYDWDDSMTSHEEAELTENGQRVIDNEGTIVTRETEVQKYPNGRITTIIRSLENAIVRDVPSSYDRLPYFLIKHDAQDYWFWGTSTYEDVRELLWDLFQTLGDITENVKLRGNPPVVKNHAEKLAEGDEAGMDRVRAGDEVIEKIPNSRRYMTPPDIASGFKHVELLQSYIDLLMGNSDALRGLGSSSGQSGAHLRQLIEQATGKLAPDVKAVSKLAIDIFRHIIYIIQTQYEDTIIQRVEDKEDGDGMEYEQFEPKAGRMVDEMGKIVPRFKLEVSGGDMDLLPVNRVEEYQIASTLNQQGKLSDSQLIDISPVRNKQQAKNHAVLHNQQVQAMQQLQAENEQLVNMVKEMQKGQPSQQVEAPANEPPPMTEKEREIYAQGGTDAQMIELAHESPMEFLELINQKPEMYMQNSTIQAIMESMPELEQQIR